MSDVFELQLLAIVPLDKRNLRNFVYVLLSSKIIEKRLRFPGPISNAIKRKKGEKKTFGNLSFFFNFHFRQAESMKFISSVIKYTCQTKLPRARVRVRARGYRPRANTREKKVARVVE